MANRNLVCPVHAGSRRSAKPTGINQQRLGEKFVTPMLLPLRAGPEATPAPTASEKIKLEAMDSLAQKLRDVGLEHQIRSLNGHAIDGLHIEMGQSWYKMLLHRFLKASEFDVASAYNQVVADTIWRDQQNVLELRQLRPSQVLQLPSVEEIWNLYSHWLAGYDPQGRPVFIVKYGGAKIWRLKELVGFENLRRLHIWEREQAISVCEALGSDMGKPVDTWVLVIDLAGTEMNQVTRDFLDWIHDCIDIDANHYPSRVEDVYIINTPLLFQPIWANF